MTIVSHILIEFPLGVPKHRTDKSPGRLLIGLTASIRTDILLNSWGRPPRIIFLFNRRQSLASAKRRRATLVKLELMAEPGDPYGISQLKSRVYDALHFGSKASSLSECNKYDSDFVTPQKVARQLAQIGFLNSRKSYKNPEQLDLLYQMLLSSTRVFPEASFILSAHIYSACRWLDKDEQQFVAQFLTLAKEGNSPLCRYSAACLLQDFNYRTESEEVLVVLKKKVPEWAEPRLKLAESLIARSAAETSHEEARLILLRAIEELLDCARNTESRGKATYQSCLEAALLSLACPGVITAECALEGARHINHNPKAKILSFSLFPREALLLWAYGKFCSGEQDNCVHGLEHLTSTKTLNEDKLTKAENLIFKDSSNERLKAFKKLYESYTHSQ